MSTNEHSFTSEYNRISIQLINECAVSNGDRSVVVNALWDTGASFTCISKNVVQKLDLTSIGKRTIVTPSSSTTVNRYLVNIKLPNNVEIVNLEVCDSEIGKGGFDVLVGMDIITRGDFAVSNYSGKTVFTFRTPSLRRTDYVHEFRLKQTAGTHGRGKRKKKNKKK